MNTFSQSPLPVFAGSSWRRHLRLFCVFLMLAGGAVRAAESSEPLGLFDAIALAERDAPMLAARRAAIDAARHQIGPAGQLPDPEMQEIEALRGRVEQLEAMIQSLKEDKIISR